MVATLSPQRASTHVTDTLAVRLVFQKLPADLLVRSLEERDYGIDLQLELFDGVMPTGGMAMVQVKGTDASFGADAPKLSFPVKTIHYALLFNAPFFVFYASIADGKVYAVHLQKYVDTKLDPKGAAWRNQKTVDIEFPLENEVNLANPGLAKIRKIIVLHRLHAVAMQVLEIDHHLRRFGEMALEDAKYDPSSCIAQAKALVQTLPFFDGRTALDEAFIRARSAELAKMFRHRAASDKLRAKYVERLKVILAEFDTSIFEYLTRNAADRALARLGDHPY